MTNPDYDQNAADLEQMQQEDALFPWLADDSMADGEYPDGGESEW